jgi:hypothetical protein
MFLGELRLNGKLSIVEVPDEHHIAELWEWAMTGLPRERVLLLSVEGRQSDVEENFSIHKRISLEMQALGFLYGDETILPVVVKNIESAPRLSVLVVLLPMMEVPCEALLYEERSPHLPAIELDVA